MNVIEHFSDEILADSLQGEAEGKTFSYVLSGWLQKISPDVKFKPQLAKQADISYSLYDQHRSSNVGYGLSYSLPVIVALLLGTLNQDSLVLIENPEAHIHPRGQYEMSQLICLCVEAGAHDNVFRFVGKRGLLSVAGIRTHPDLSAAECAHSQPQ